MAVDGNCGSRVYCASDDGPPDVVSANRRDAAVVNGRENSE
jgi:hypothetical protein